MGFRLLSVAMVTSLALVAGCAGAKAPDTAAPAGKTNDAEVPYWIVDGVRLARDTKASWGDGETSSNRPSTPTSTPQRVATLPDRELVVPGLVALGLAETEAHCMYDNLAANEDATEAAVALLSALSGLDPAAAASPTMIASLSTLDEQTMSRVVLSVAPCLSPTSLATILLTAQGLAPGAMLAGLAPGGANIAGMLGGVDLAALTSLNLDPATLAGLQAMLSQVDVAALARNAAGGLGPVPVQQLEQLLRNTFNTDANLASILADPALLLNLDKLDLSKIPTDQLPLLFLAIARGLTPSQQGQLQNMAQLTFDDLDLRIDPTKLTSEEIGGLLLILGPLLANAVRDENSPPIGWDPSQIYIPEGADLSGINPLLFLDRQATIDSFVKQGINPNIGACFFDSLRSLAPTTLAGLFSTTGSEAATSSLLLAAFVCVLRG
ncbi:MAG: hypothetical protein GX868_15180 [Actinobacteria bacterium]|nr:hypothetical protein [Actinomycetota bacterium]